MATFAFILSELFPLDYFRCNFVSAPYHKNPLVYYHDTLQLCRTGLDDVSDTKMLTLAFLLSELFPLDFFRCNFVSAPYLDNPLVFYHDTSRLYRTHLDDVSGTRMTTLSYKHNTLQL